MHDNSIMNLFTFAYGFYLFQIFQILLQIFFFHDKDKIPPLYDLWTAEFI